MRRILTDERLKAFEHALIQEEKKLQTIQKYMRDIRKLADYLDGRELTKERLISYKEYLAKSGVYRVTSINSFLAVANHFCEMMDWNDLHVKLLKIQREVFIPENKELTVQEYERLIWTAMKRGNERLALLIQTIGSTGIRISELPYITVESLGSGMADIYNKGKMRRILYPSELVRLLQIYVRNKNITNGSIFCTESGKPMHRSNIWRDMKRLCQYADVDSEKVYPHNLRHLFARCFYKIKHDIAKLADVLGHCSIDTTRIYIKSTGKEHKRQLNQMHLVISDAFLDKKIR